MSSYLWDRSGAPDSEIEHLEELLAPMRHGGAGLRPERRWRPQYLAIAASALVVISAWAMLRSNPVLSKPTSWTVTDVEGSVSLGHASAVASGRLRTGESLITDNSSHAALEAEDFGRVEVRPGSEVRVLESAAARQRIMREMTGGGEFAAPGAGDLFRDGPIVTTTAP